MSSLVASRRVSYPDRMRAIGVIKRVLMAIGAVDPVDITRCQDLSRGRVALVGTLRVERPVLSPVHERPCAAFSYSARAVGSGRATDAARRRLLRTATVYASGLTLELEGGSVPLEPPASDDFDVAAHRALATMDLAGFAAEERTLRDGQRVRVLGTALPQGEGWQVRVLQIGGHDD